ncbi:hypothetical protein ES703_70081 [subsurface metagenome]
MFLHCRNEGEIQQELADKRVSISKREVSFLAKKFIMYLSVAHKQSQHRIRELLSIGGGYITAQFKQVVIQLSLQTVLPILFPVMGHQSVFRLPDKAE